MVIGKQQNYINTNKRAFVGIKNCEISLCHIRKHCVYIAERRENSEVLINT